MQCPAVSINDPSSSDSDSPDTKLFIAVHAQKVLRTAFQRERDEGEDELLEGEEVREGGKRSVCGVLFPTSTTCGHVPRVAVTFTGVLRPGLQ